MKATTVILVPICLSRKLRPENSKALVTQSRSMRLKTRLTSKRFDEHVNSLVSVLVSTSSEEVKGVVKIEVVVTVEMTSDEVVDLLFRNGVKILELVHGRELGDVETVGSDSV